MLIKLISFVKQSLKNFLSSPIEDLKLIYSFSTIIAFSIIKLILEKILEIFFTRAFRNLFTLVLVN